MLQDGFSSLQKLMDRLIKQNVEQSRQEDAVGAVTSRGQPSHTGANNNIRSLTLNFGVEATFFAVETNRRNLAEFFVNSHANVCLLCTEQIST